MGTISYYDQVIKDCSVTMWLLSSIDEKVSTSVMFLKTAKGTWDTLKEMYSNKKNISYITGSCEKLFSL